MRLPAWEGRRRAGPRRVPGLVPGAVLLTVCVSCEQFGGPMPWGVETVYEIEDIDESARRRLEKALRERGYGPQVVDGGASGGGYEEAAYEEEPPEQPGGERMPGVVPAPRAPRWEPGSTFRFRLRNVRNMQDLRSVQALIQEVSQGARVPVVLQGATMRFSSVSGMGSAKIWVSGRATPGAEVILDVGQEEVRALVDASGRWTVAVERSSQLRRRGGWIYALIRKGTALQYLRMNVLDVAHSERLLREQLPVDSSLRRY